MSVLIGATVRKAMPFTRLLGVLLASGALGCSSLDAESDTCSSIGNPLDPCQTGGGGSGGTDGTLQPVGPPLYEQARFACLAPGFTPAPLTPPANMMVNLTAIVVDYANPTTTQLQQLLMAFCQQQDTICEGDATPKAVSVPGMGPLVNLTVPVGSNGYLRQEAANHFRQDYYLLAPMMKDDASLVGPTKAFFLVGNDSLAGFITDMGIAVDPMLGIMAFFIEDCNGNRVEGATLRLPDANTRPELRSANVYAINDGYPVPDRLTQADGTAGFVNVPIGTVQVEVVVDGHPYGTTRLRVAAGRLTAATLRPIYNTGR
jgi:hypothetical protein